VYLSVFSFSKKNRFEQRDTILHDFFLFLLEMF